MRVLHLNAADRIGGAGIAAYRLHKALTERDGIDSKLLVGLKTVDDPTVYSLFPDKYRYAMNRIAHRFSIRRGTDGFTAFGTDRCLRNMVSAADLIHLHNIHGGFHSLPAIFSLAKGKPVVWMLHDYWSVTGGCCFPHNCEAYVRGCREPSTCTVQSAERNWMRKRDLYATRYIELIVPSPRMKSEIEKSPIFAHCRIHCIPFGIDTDVYRPQDDAPAKRSFGIPIDAFVIGFRSNPDRKGLHYIKKCLAHVEAQKNIWLLTFDQVGLVEELKGSFPVVEMGWIGDDVSMARAFAAMDLFLMPSEAEAFGLMAIECMACARPVIVFQNTVLSETILAPAGGIAIPFGDTKAMRDNVVELYSNPNLRRSIGETAYQLARKHYAFEQHVNNITALYEMVL